MSSSANMPRGERRWIDRKAAWEAASDRTITSQTQGAPFSAYIVKAKPGQGPPLHKHPYVEVAFTLEGCATITIGDEQRELKAGSIVVIPADTPHRFVNSGDMTLRQIDVHASAKFVQTNL